MKSHVRRTFGLRGHFPKWTIRSGSKAFVARTKGGGNSILAALLEFIGFQNHKENVVRELLQTRASCYCLSMKDFRGRESNKAAVYFLLR